MELDLIVIIIQSYIMVKKSNIDICKYTQMKCINKIYIMTPLIEIYANTH